jgi:hypothetical protein
MICQPGPYRLKANYIAHSILDVIELFVFLYESVLLCSEVHIDQDTQQENYG